MYIAMLQMHGMFPDASGDQHLGGSVEAEAIASSSCSTVQQTSVRSQCNCDWATCEHILCTAFAAVLAASVALLVDSVRSTVRLIGIS
jgi:hypothetical protein